MSSVSRAARVIVAGSVQGVGFRAAVVQRAHELGAAGWVRNEADGTVAAHVEGPAGAVEGLLAFLGEGPPGAAVSGVTITESGVEGHEQFAIRGVEAGVFLVHEHRTSSRRFDLQLEVDGTMRSWTLPKGPSLDPGVKRLALQLPDREIARMPVEGLSDAGAVLAWDHGSYEQGGRVPWPEALERGHAVFVLHGEKLRGGFALQRTRTGSKPQWLLIKRRDEHARPASDIVVERPESAVSGKTFDQLLPGER